MFCYALSLGVLLYATACWGQTTNYYMGGQGEILDEASYQAQKETMLQSMQKRMATIDLVEELTEAYRRNDSVVYRFKWHFTDHPEQKRQEIRRKQALIGQPYPIEGAQTLAGRSISLADLQGKPTLINLWFTTCKPCIEEMPVLNRMKAQHGDRFNFLAITYEEEATVRQFLQRVDYQFEQIAEAEELTTALGFEGYPVNLFLDPDGVLQHIKGNIPYQQNEDGELDMEDGSEFIAILESLLVE